MKIVFVGRLSYQKGIDRVIEVFSYLDNIEFIVIGEGPEKKRLDKMCLQYNLDKKIKFYGFIKITYLQKNFVFGTNNVTLYFSFK